MNICPQCGEELKKKKAKVCPHCGYDLRNDPKGYLADPDNLFSVTPSVQETFSSEDTASASPLSGSGKQKAPKAPKKKDPNGFGTLMTQQEREAYLSETFHPSMLLETQSENYLISPRDIAANKDLSMLCYAPFLFWLPLLSRPGSRFIRFHSNQGMLLSIVEAVWWILEYALTKYFNDQLLYFLSILLASFNLVILILIGFGILNASNGRAKEMPIFGQFRIISTIRPPKHRP